MIVPFYLAVRAIVAVWCRLFWRLSIHGRDRLPEGPFILAPIHRSNIDFAIAASVTSRPMRLESISTELAALTPVASPVVTVTSRPMTLEAKETG